MNPVLILTHNNLALTKRCVESVRAQDIRADVRIFDNGSSDGTCQWAEEERILLDLSPNNEGFSKGVNEGLSRLFAEGEDHCLCVGNDTVLPAFFYRELLSYDVPFVTGFEVQTMAEIEVCPPRFPLQPHPDFSAFLIHRGAWEKIGKLNEDMKNYCSDCDLHVRGHRLGVGMWKATVPYYHERSSTMRLAPPEERDAIAMQAGEDRKVFQSIYGVIPGQPGYAELFK